MVNRICGRRAWASGWAWALALSERAREREREREREPSVELSRSDAAINRCHGPVSSWAPRGPNGATGGAEGPMGYPARVAVTYPFHQGGGIPFLKSWLKKPVDGNAPLNSVSISSFSARDRRQHAKYYNKLVREERETTSRQKHQIVVPSKGRIYNIIRIFNWFIILLFFEKEKMNWAPDRSLL